MLFTWGLQKIIYFNEREKELKEQSSFKTKFAFHLFVSV